MRNDSWLQKFLAVAVLTIAAALALTSIPGCGSSNSPEGAVQKYLNAWQSGDWNAFKASVAPARRQLTQVQETLAKQKFEQIKVKFDGVKLKSEINKDNPARAVVTLTDGKVTYTTEVIGKSKTETQDIAKMAVEQKPAYDVIQGDGTWYVDMAL